jgi:hypothetical protein
MAIKLPRHLALIVVSAAAGSVIGTAITWADPPGYLFMDIKNNDALVVQRPHDQVTARIFKQPAKLPDDLAAAIAAGAQPVGDDVILAYKGQLYILPDKDIKGHMATHMVMAAAGAPNHGE